MKNVLCMKWGTKYGPAYVNVLHAMVGRHLSPPFRFICLTDDADGIEQGIECRPLPSIELGGAPPHHGWRKISVFSPALHDLDGRVLFLDLDIVVVAALDPFFEQPGAFCIIENWTQRGSGIGNSSVFRFEAGAHLSVFEKFCRNAAAITRAHPNSQTWLSKAIGEKTYWPKDWCRSFKHHCLPGRLLRPFVPPRLPEGARIIVFHGDPKPPDAARGVWPGGRRRLRAAPWIAEHWR